MEKDKGMKKLTSAQIFHFFEQLRALTGAGITPYAALQIMRKDMDNQNIDRLLAGLSDQIAGGCPLSEAVRSSGVFPEYAVQLLVIGERTGKDEQVYGALSRYYEEEDDLRNSIRSAVAYPIAMIGMIFVVVLVLLTRVMPIFSQVFSQLGTSVGGVTQVLMDLSQTISRYYAVLIVIFVLLAAAFLYFYYTEKGRQQFSSLLEKCPLTRRFTEDLALTRFASGLHLTSSAGLDPHTSLELIEGTVGNEAVRRKIQDCRARLLNGERFSEAVSGAGLFSGFYSRMLNVFAESGHVDSAMDFIATHYKEETDRRINGVLSSIEPTMVAVLSLIVGLILLSVIMPLMGIMSNIG